MRLLVFGSTGQVGRELARRQTGHELTWLDRSGADLANPESCAAAIDAHRPDAVINAAAYTAVDKAESEPDLAQVVNGTAPGAMARTAARQQIPFVHVSTDYVFAGTGTTAWRETDPVAPQNIYGSSKLAGEDAVRAAGGHAVVLRTSWVFSAHGSNFVKTMLRLSETRDTLRVVDDQVGGPTPASAIADALLRIATALAEGAPGGTYHFAGQPPVSWAGFARETLRRAGRAVTVTGIPTAEYPTPARRPLNSRLDCSALERDFAIAPPDWCDGLDAVLRDLAA
jgi:dTDP-4-dehydrorhamnose reductase